MAERLVTIRVGGAEATFRVLDSSDGLETANIHLQEVLLWSSYVRRFQELYFPHPEGREETLRIGALLCEPVLLAQGLDPETAGRCGDAIASGVLDRLLPMDEDPAKPGETTFERLARAQEYRRRSLRKLLVALAKGADAATLDAFCEEARDWGAAQQMIDELMGGGDEHSDENKDSGSGDGAHIGASGTAGDDEGARSQAGVPGAGEDAGHQPGGDPAGPVDGGGDAGPGDGGSDRLGGGEGEDTIRADDAENADGDGSVPRSGGQGADNAIDED